MVDRFSCDILEFEEIRELLKEFLSGSITQPLLASLAPETGLKKIQTSLAQMAEAREYLRKSRRPLLGGLEDPRAILEKLRVEGVTCTSHEILAVLASARRSEQFRKCFDRTQFPNLADRSQALADFCPLLSELDGKIHPDGSLDSSASPELARIRRAVERLRGEVQSTLESLLLRLSHDDVLQDATVLVRNERLVIPVRIEGKRRVPGVIHGTSSSGATVFLEPLETVPLNNELVELEDQEYAETQRILGEFSGRIRSVRAELLMALGILAEIDLAFAKAAFAAAYDCCLPQFTEQKDLWLKDLRHPLLEKTLRTTQSRPVPLTIGMQEPKRLMVISGPNTGGKTVALKAVGIAALMAQAGLPVAASEARLPLFERVLADIGDLQSIQASLSTFSAHITNICSMVEVVGPSDLVLLDELGSSTEPGEGAALAMAILDRFRASGAMTFITTHLSRLKAYAAETVEALNAAMEFDEESLRPTYRLITGLAGKSSALEIAGRLGLPADILSRARRMIEPAEAEAAALLRSLHELKASYELQLERLRTEERQIDARRAELELQFSQERAKKIKELDSRLEVLLREIEKRWEGALNDLRTQLQAARLRRNVDRKFTALKQDAREEWKVQVLESLTGNSSPQEPAQEATVSVGDRVQVPNLSSSGTVTAILADEQIEVEVGRLRLRIARDQARVLSHAPEPGAPARTPSGVNFKGSAVEVPYEINVIGCTAEEAMARVDEYLDRAYMAGRFKLRVIHGFGKGILQRSLHEMFAAHPHVEKFSAAPQNEGGAGATIVELKI